MSNPTAAACPHGQTHDPARFVKADGHCWACWRAARSGGSAVATVAEFRGTGRKGMADKYLAPPCRFRGTDPVGTGSCKTCGGTKTFPLLACDVHGRCHTSAYTTDEATRCMGCDRREEPLPQLSAPPTTASPAVVGLAPLFRHKIESRLLAGKPDDHRFNCSIFRHQDRLLLAYRTGWAGAQCHVSELDPADYRPRSGTTLALSHPDAKYGREDPRLFAFAGRLHVAFVGVMGPNGPTNVLYARLRDDLTVEQIYSPRLPKRQAWEKNWSFFEWNDLLLCVYETGPTHRVYHVRENEAYPFAETPNALPWSGGFLRGGAPPVRVGDRYYHWFHGQRPLSGAMKDYSIGVNVFEAKPPFRVVRQTPRPILRGDVSTKPANQYTPTVFPAGAVLHGGIWKVSYGVHDRWCEVAGWDAAAVDAALAPAA
jgi:predicted GH43/DUF377 family glycosyl hydrolase